MPRSFVRLSAGRESMSEAEQALCFLAGANSIFYGDKLLTTGNPDTQADDQLLQKLGLQAFTASQNEGVSAPILKQDERELIH